MNDLISRHLVRLIESDSNAYPQVWNEDYEKGFCDAINRVLDLPSAQKKGHWINIIEGKWNTVTVLKCSVCGGMDNRMYGTANFCPNCGADMRQKEYGYE